MDLDGTLLGPSGQVSERNLQAMRAAEAAGIRIVVATGRRHTYAMKLLRELGLSDSSTLVSSNGTVTSTLDSSLLSRAQLSRSASEWVCGRLSEFRDALVMTFDRVGPDGEEVRGSLVVEDLRTVKASIERWVAANETSIMEVRPIERALEAAEPIQMMLCGSLDRMHRAEARLLEDSRVLGVGEAMRPGVDVVLNRTSYPERDLCILDILPYGCSKGMALLRLASQWALPPEAIMAIGDNWNDVSMFEVAGWPVLMGNAMEELKEMAATKFWNITERNDEDGVAIAIEGVLSRQLAPDGLGF